MANKLKLSDTDVTFVSNDTIVFQLTGNSSFANYWGVRFGQFDNVVVTQANKIRFPFTLSTGYTGALATTQSLFLKTSDIFNPICYIYITTNTQIECIVQVTIEYFKTDMALEFIYQFESGTYIFSWSTEGIYIETTVNKPLINVYNNLSANFTLQ